ncbi:MAG TPA: AbfB domain-containing protein [Burkholderiaceae bacterium]|nr:AbfB domain-containing protein [Burkholderiaceae bacterium]
MKFGSAALAAAGLALAGSSAFAAMDILGNRYDANRTAANLTETALNPSTVSSSTFGKLWTYPVDGAIFAQPLYVRNVAISATATHNVVYVATMNDVVYALDADAPDAPLWIRDYRGATVSPGTPFDITTASTAMGIVGTPAIDLPNNRMYFVAETMESGAYVQRLHEVDIRSGAELGTTTIAATSKGITFDPKMHTQRPGLALAGGQVWIAFASTIPGDFTPWHGWVMTYDMNTLAQTGAFVTTTTGSGGGIWQSGAAPSVDASGNVYYLTGNGTGQAYDGVNNFQESLLKFNYSGGLNLLDWYTASDWSTLDSYDLDLTVGGSTLIPGTNLIAFGGKIGMERLLNTGNLGKFTSADTQVVQKLQVGPVPNYAGNDGDRILGIAYWNRGATNSRMFAWPGLASLTSYTFNGTQFVLNQQNGLNLYGEPSAALSLSANGTTPGTGILWVARNQGGGRNIGQTAVLEAYNADNIAQPIWSSTTNVGRDDVISSGRFVIPVVNNGKMYMATGSNALQVYGLLPATSGVAPQLPLVESTSEPTAQARAVSLQPVGYLNYRVRHQNFIGYISAINGLGSALDVADSSFVARPGLANSGCYSFEAKGYPGYFLTNVALEVLLKQNDGSAAFATNATFCSVPGLAGNGVSFQPLALPGYYVRHRNYQLWIDKLGSINPGSYNADASFNVVDPGEVSLQAVNDAGYLVRQSNFVGAISPISATNPVTDKLDADFNVRPGLAGSCVTFESRRYPGYYLRHQNFEVFLMQNDGSTLFTQDATFCPVAGLAGTGTSFQSVNYPGYYMRHWNNLLWLDPSTNAAHSPGTFKQDASFTPQGNF